MGDLDDYPQKWKDSFSSSKYLIFFQDSWAWTRNWGCTLSSSLQGTKVLFYSILHGGCMDAFRPHETIQSSFPSTALLFCDWEQPCDPCSLVHSGISALTCPGSVSFHSRHRHCDLEVQKVKKIKFLAGYVQGERVITGSEVYVGTGMRG